MAQSFVDTHVDQPPSECAKIENLDMQQTPDFCCPCGGFLGWKQIRLGGKSLSRSYGDLRATGGLQTTRGWAWETPTALSHPRRPSFIKEAKDSEIKPQFKRQPGSSPLEKMPPEVLRMLPFLFFSYSSTV